MERSATWILVGSAVASASLACGPPPASGSGDSAPILRQGPDEVLVKGSVRWPAAAAQEEGDEIVAFNLGSGKVWARERLRRSGGFEFVLAGPPEPVALLLEARGGAGTRPLAPFGVLRVAPEHRGRRLTANLGAESSLVALVSFQMAGRWDEATFWTRPGRKDPETARLALRMPDLEELAPGLAHIPEIVDPGEGPADARLWRQAGKLTQSVANETDRILSTAPEGDRPTSEAIEAAVLSHIASRLHASPNRNIEFLSLDPPSRGTALDHARLLDRRADGAVLPTPSLPWSVREAGPALAAAQGSGDGLPDGDPLPQETPEVW